MPKVNYLKYLRTKANISQACLCKKIGLTIRVLRRYEHDRHPRSMIYKRALSFAEFFDVSIAPLLSYPMQIEISEQEYLELFPPPPPKPDANPLMQLFLTQPRRSLKETIEYLNRNKSNTSK